MYWKQSVSIKIGENVFSSVPMAVEVPEGCILSPLLFNIYFEHVFQNALENYQKSVKVTGKLINNIRYAEDAVILADTPEGLQRLLDTIVQGEAFGRTINTGKTKTQVVRKYPNLQANNLSYLCKRGQ